MNTKELFIEVDKVYPFLYAPAGTQPLLADGKCGEITFEPEPVSAAPTLFVWSDGQLKDENSAALWFFVYSSKDTDVGIHDFIISLTSSSGYMMPRFAIRVDV